jgi:hypothetical protein
VDRTISRILGTAKTRGAVGSVTAPLERIQREIAMPLKDMLPYSTMAMRLGIIGAIWLIAIVATGLAARSWLYLAGPVAMLAVALLFGIAHMRGGDRR